MDDPALVTALLIELGKALSQGGGIGTDEAQQTGLDCIFGAIERYRHLARLQVHALNVLSLSLNESDSAKVSSEGEGGSEEKQRARARGRERARERARKRARARKHVIRMLANRESD